MTNLRIIGVLAALGTVGFTFAIGASPPSAGVELPGNNSGPAVAVLSTSQA